MTPLLLLVHGWGFDAGFWTPLRARFAPEDTLAWDLGFFGAPARPAPPPGREVVAVGHSFGLLWLLHERPLPWRGLVGINGFTRFAQGEDFPAGIAPRVLARMQARLAADAAAVAREFRAKLGDTAPLPGSPDAAALTAGLEALTGWDERGARVDAALCGEADGLVAPAMSAACFTAAARRWHAGGHLLPQEAPDWCAAQLRDAVERLP